MAGLVGTPERPSGRTGFRRRLLGKMWHRLRKYRYWMGMTALALTALAGVAVWLHGRKRR